MIGSREPFLTNLALIRFNSWMGSLMTSKFIRAWKSPSTPGPSTRERFFSCVTAQMSLKMRTLAVNLIAAIVGAVVDFFVDLRVFRHRAVGCPWYRWFWSSRCWGNVTEETSMRKEGVSRRVRQRLPGDAYVMTSRVCYKLSIFG